MSRKALISAIIFAITSLLHGQSATPKVDNVHTSQNSKNIEIHYNLNGCGNAEVYRVDLAVVDNRGHVIRPDSVLGDLGTGISCGKRKKITWEIYKEYDVVYGDFSPRIVLDGGKYRNHMRGPEYALLSLAFPGLGDYFVARPADMNIKPYMRTAFTLGVLGLSWLAWDQREAIPPVMAPPGFYVSADTPVGDKYIYIDHYWMQKPASTDYFLFQKDAEILFGIGIASWIFDVVWGLRKGVVNQRVMKSINGDLSMIPSPGGQGAMLSYRIKF